MIESTWRGKAMRHDDGRTGVIKSDDDCGLFRILTIRVDQPESPEVKLTLHCWGKDEGERGWKWEFSPDNYPGEWAYLLDIDKDRDND
jgi:hypothetical protein